MKEPFEPDKTLDPSRTASFSTLARHRLRWALRAGRYQTFSLARWASRLAMWGAAIAVGGLAVAFALGADHAFELFRKVVAVSPWLPLIVTPAGLVAIAWVTQRWVPGARGSGIPQSIAALDVENDHLRSRLLSLRIALAKIGLTVAGMASGATIGREGPTVQVGAAVMYSLGRLGRAPRPHFDRALILAGGAAGIAAAFNTPLAGIVFAIEEMGRSFEERTSGTMLTAVFFAGVTALWLLGDYAYFGRTDVNFALGGQWVAIAVCGVTGGLLGGLFSNILILTTRKLARRIARHPLRVAAICGVILALLGLISGGMTYGTGYDEARAAITGADAGNPFYPALKMAATVVSYLSGIPGGIFAPSLAVGAGLGADLAAWFPDVPASAIVILGMVGYFSGVVQTPITAFVIVMEMTDHHGMVFPLIATSFLGYGVSRLVCHKPLYRALAEQFLREADRRGAAR